MVTIITVRSADHTILETPAHIRILKLSDIGEYYLDGRPWELHVQLTKT